MKNPRIYVGTWAKYNAGSLSGEWLALRDYDNYSELCEVMRAIHEDESDPEPMLTMATSGLSKHVRHTQNSLR